MGHVELGALILAGEHAPGVHDVHHAARGRVDDGQVEPRAKGGRQEGGVHERTERQAKADVGDAKHRAHARQLALHKRNGVEDGPRCRLVGGGRHAQAVHHHVVARHAGGVGCRHNLARHREAPLGRGRDTVLVDRERHERTAVVGRDGHHLGKHLVLAVR